MTTTGSVDHRGSDLPPPVLPAEPLPPPAPPEAPPPRRHEGRRSRRGATLAVLGVLLVVALLVPALVAVAARTIANSREGRAASETVARPVTAVLPDTPAALLALVDDGEVHDLVVLARAADGTGGTIIQVPVGSEIAVPGTVRTQRLGDTYGEGGLQSLVEGTEGFLQITLDAAAELDQRGLAELLEPYAPFPVELTDDVVATGAEGEDTVVLSAGTYELDAPTLVNALVAERANESETSVLANRLALWRGVAAGLSRAGSVPATTSPSSPLELGSIDAAVTALGAGPVAAAGIPATAIIDPVRNPDGIDLLAADMTAARLLAARVLPGAVSPANDNLRIRLVNSLGDPRLTYRAVGRLAYVGANVVIVSEPDQEAPARTIIEHSDPADAEEAAFYAPVVGGAEVRPSEQRIDGIDVTIVLGESFRDFLAAEDARTTTTLARSSIGVTRSGSASASSTSTVPTPTTVRSGGRP